MADRIKIHMEHAEGKKRKHTLMVGTWYSQCGYCGMDTLSSAKTHEIVSGYGGETPGCGVEFKYIHGLYNFTNTDPNYSLAKHMQRDDLEEISMDQLNDEEV